MKDELKVGLAGLGIIGGTVLLYLGILAAIVIVIVYAAKFALGLF